MREYPFVSMTLTETVNTPCGEASIVLAHYQSTGLLAVNLVTAKTNLEKDEYEGEPIASLSFNPSNPGGAVHLASMTPGIFCVKTWGGNEEIVNLFRDSDLFVDSGEKIEAGHASGEIWSLKGTALAQYLEAMGVDQHGNRIETDPADSPAP